MGTTSVTGVSGHWQMPKCGSQHMTLGVSRWIGPKWHNDKEVVEDRISQLEDKIKRLEDLTNWLLEREIAK